MRIVVKAKGPTPGHLAKRAWNAILKAAYAVTGTYWKTNFRAKHFTQSGANEYGYALRRGQDMGFGTKSYWRSYTGKKQRYLHHVRPLVFSGESERRTQAATVRATFKGVTVTMNAPALNFRPKNSRVNMRKEMTTISIAEEATLNAVFAAEVRKGLDGVTDQTTTRI